MAAQQGRVLTLSKPLMEKFSWFFSFEVDKWKWFNIIPALVRGDCQGEGQNRSPA